MKRKIGLLCVTMLTSLLALVNVKVVRPNEAPKAQTLEVKDVLEKGAIEGSGRVVRRAAAPATEYGMSDTFLQVTAPDADGTVDVRFVAGIDSYAYTEAKFGVEMFAGTEYKGSIEKAVTTAYAAMEIDGEVKTASEVFGEGYNYLIAYTMKDMPKDSWENGFRATVGLKAEGDEEFTEQETQEIKLVKSALMADNHLFFTLNPWGDITTNATLAWENDIAPASVIGKVKVTLTFADGTITEVIPSATHLAGLLVSAPGRNLKESEYHISVEIEMEDGKVARGEGDYTKFADVPNAKVTLNDEGEYVLTFDTIKDATSYTYQIFNDSYLGTTYVANPNGTVLSTAALATGTYSVKVIIKGNYHATNETIIPDALSVENAVENQDGSNKFDFEIYHEGGAWEMVFRFKPIDAVDTITKDNALTDLVVKDDSKTYNTVFQSRTSNGVRAKQAYPYYDADTGYYTIGVNVQDSWPSISKVFNMTFFVETDAGVVYSINLYYVVDQTAGAIGTSISEVQAEANAKLEEYYAGQLEKNITTFVNNLNSEFAKYKSDDYTEENWATMNSIYETALADIQNATSHTQPESIFNNAATQLKSVKQSGKQIIDAATKKTWKVSTDETQEFRTDGRLTDNNYKNGWQLSNNAAGRYYLIELDKAYDLVAMYIKWEAANCADYDILVSSDNVEWREAASFSENPGLHEREDNLTLTNATNVKYVKILMNIPGTGYGYQAREIDLFIAG